MQKLKTLSKNKVVMAADEQHKNEPPPLPIGKIKILSRLRNKLIKDAVTTPSGRKALEAAITSAAEREHDKEGGDLEEIKAKLKEEVRIALLEKYNICG